MPAADPAAASGLELTRLLQLASSTLPVGGFAYSRGMEWATEAGWIAGERGAKDWIGGLLVHEVGGVEAPLLMRLVRACQERDVAATQTWATVAAALKGSRELWEEGRRSGASLSRLLVDLRIAGAEELPSSVRASYLAVFAQAAVNLGLDEQAAVIGYAWSWLESMVLAAVKLVPLGQTAGQRLLLDLGAELANVERRARTVQDDEIGALAPGYAMACAFHERQRTRLFRS